MPAYIIVLREEAIGDAEAFAAYQSKTRELRGDFQITPRECESCDFGSVCRYVELGVKEG